MGVCAFAAHTDMAKPIVAKKTFLISILELINKQLGFIPPSLRVLESSRYQLMQMAIRTTKLFRCLYMHCRIFPQYSTFCGFFPRLCIFKHYIIMKYGFYIDLSKILILNDLTSIMFYTIVLRSVYFLSFLGL